MDTEYLWQHPLTESATSSRFWEAADDRYRTITPETRTQRIQRERLEAAKLADDRYRAEAERYASMGRHDMADTYAIVADTFRRVVDSATEIERALAIETTRFVRWCVNGDHRTLEEFTEDERTHA